MKLYAITISGVYPPQLATVMDIESNANQCAQFIKSKMSQLKDYVNVIEVDSFWPHGYCEADSNIQKAVSEYNAGTV